MRFPLVSECKITEGSRVKPRRKQMDSFFHVTGLEISNIEAIPINQKHNIKEYG